MEFLSSAKKRVMDLGANIMLNTVHATSDPTLLMLKSKMGELLGVVHDLRIDLSNYAASMNQAAKLTMKTGLDFASIYRLSEARQKSIGRFSESSRSIDQLSHRVWIERFDQNILGVLDLWKQQIDAILVDIHNGEHQFRKLCKAIAKRDMQSAGSSSKDDGADASQTDILQSSFDLTCSRLKDRTKRLLDARYAILDVLFVGIMESQIEYFSGASSQVDGLKGNIESYRKRFPIGTLPDVLNEKFNEYIPPSNDQSDKQGGASHSAQSDESDSEEDDEEEPSVEAPPNKPSAVAPSSNGEMNRKSSTQQGSGSNIVPLAAREASNSSPSPPAIIDLLHGGFDMSSPITSTSSPAPSVQPFDYLSPTTSSVPALSNSMTDLFGAMFTNTTPSQNPAFGTPVTQPSSKSSISPSLESTDGVDPSETNPRIRLMQAQMHADNQLRDDKWRAADTVTFPLDNWEYGIGNKRKHIRVLLTTLNTVLPPSATLPIFKMADLGTPALVKKAYRQTVLQVHPDKVKGASAEVQVISERIFNAIQVQMKSFEEIG